MRLKRYKRKKIGDYLTRGIIIIILSLLCSIIVINYFSKMVDKILLPMGISKTRKFVTEIINASSENIEFSDELFVINRDDNNEIKMVTYNSYEVTKLINTITGNIQNSIDELDNGSYNDKDSYVISEFPIGVIFDNSLLRNIGPKIKLRLNILSDIVSNVETEVKPYGINNAYVEMRVNLEVTARVILPFVSEEVKISNVIPISMNIVQGTVPEAYISSYK